jgi:hypothetical protein
MEEAERELDELEHLHEEPGKAARVKLFVVILATLRT